MKLIVGLGNRGEKYKNTRHNIGFMAVDELAKMLESKESAWKDDKNLKSAIKSLSAKSQKLTANSLIILMRPTTFMNNSGFAVSKVLN